MLEDASYNMSVVKEIQNAELNTNNKGNLGLYSTPRTNGKSANLNISNNVLTFSIHKNHKCIHVCANICVKNELFQIHTHMWNHSGERPYQCYMYM
jgi:hypothetical protein